MTPEQTINELGLRIPDPPPPVGSYLGAVEHENLLFVSGHGPFDDGAYEIRGKVGATVTIEEAREAARLTMLSALGTVRAALGSLDRVDRVVRLFGMVNCDPDFVEQPKVIDGASDLLIEIFGEHGRHARSAVGHVSLPMGIAVEIEMVLAVKPAV